MRNAFSQSTHCTNKKTKQFLLFINELTTQAPHIMSYAYYMPSKRERLYASKAGNTHAIWSRVISESDEPTGVTDPAGEQLWLGVRHRVMTSKAKHGTSSTCKRCHGCGHFTFECRNHLSLVPSTGKVQYYY